jgi:xyloglucan fucosyltransferase
MQQRKPKPCAAESTAQEIPVSQGGMPCDGWPEADGARPEHWSLPRKKRLALDKKRWSTVANIVLVAFVMAVPLVVVVYAGGGGAPTVWIAAAKAQLSRGEFPCDGCSHGSWIASIHFDNNLLRFRFRRPLLPVRHEPT